MGNIDDAHEWLEGCLLEGVSRVELLRSVDKTRLREWQWPKNGAANDTGNLEARVKEIVRTAERDGAVRHQKEVIYVALAYRTDADAGAGHFAEHTFTVPGRNATTKAQGDEEFPPTMIGMMQLAFRHIETTHRLLLQSLEGKTAHLERMLEHETARAQASDKRHLEILQLTEDLVSARHLRELNERRALQDEKNHALIAQKLDVLVPIVINRFMGGGPGTGKLPAAHELIKQLFGRMEKETLEGLLGGAPIALTPDQAMLVAEIYTTFGEAEKARDGAKAAGDPRPLNQSSTSNGAVAPSKEPPS